MKNLLLTAVFLLASVLFYGASAQDYQPFRKGPTYHFIAQDSIYSMRIDSARAENGDSVFVFNQTIKPVNSGVGSLCGQTMALVRAEVNFNNQFGHKMVKKTNGEFIFKSVSGAEFTLKTMVSVGQSWLFSSNSAITATLTAKAIEQVLTVSDSVYSYSLSNGSTIKLSKNYGFLKAPNFVSYADGSFRPKTLDFYALPEKQLGKEISTVVKIYDFQPGDSFGYYKTQTKASFGSSLICSETWTRINITARTGSGNQVSFTYTRDVLQKTYGNPNAPSQFCQGTTGHSITSNTGSLSISNGGVIAIGLLSNGFFAHTNTSGISNGAYSTGIFRSNIYNQRMQTGSTAHEFCPASNAFITRVDPSVTKIWYGVGLGITRQEYGSYPEAITEILECYTKGSETYGNCLSFAQILASKEETATQPFNIYPNPFTSGISLQLNPELQKGSLEVSLKNVLGQKVFRKNISAEKEVKLTLPELPKGIYVLQISGNGKTHLQKLVRE